MRRKKNQTVVTFGKRVARLRRIHDVKQADLATDAGITTKALSEIERGLTAPSFLTLIKLAEALKVPISQLFADDQTGISSISDAAMLLRAMDTRTRNMAVRVLYAMMPKDAVFGARSSP